MTQLVIPVAPGIISHSAKDHLLRIVFFFFFNDTAPTEIYPFPLHAPFPIWREGEGGWGGAILGEEGLEPLECPLAPGEADAVDGEIVDQTRVEMMLGVTGARLRHAG